MSASQPALFNVQEFTDDGITLVGGRLYTYAYGTTTQKVAYTDPEGLVPQTYTADGLGGQYIALNVRGEISTPLYLGGGSYDIALKRADGSIVWTRKADGVENSTEKLRGDLASTTGPTIINYRRSPGRSRIENLDTMLRRMWPTQLEYDDLQAAVDDNYGAVLRLVKNSDGSSIKLPPLGLKILNPIRIIADMGDEAVGYKMVVQKVANTIGIEVLAPYVELENLWVQGSKDGSLGFSDTTDTIVWGRNDGANGQSTGYVNAQRGRLKNCTITKSGRDGFSWQEGSRIIFENMAVLESARNNYRVSDKAFDASEGEWDTVSAGAGADGYWIGYGAQVLSRAKSFADIGRGFYFNNSRGSTGQIFSELSGGPFIEFGPSTLANKIFVQFWSNGKNFIDAGIGNELISMSLGGNSGAVFSSIARMNRIYVRNEFRAAGDTSAYPIGAFSLRYDTDYTATIGGSLNPTHVRWDLAGGSVQNVAVWHSSFNLLGFGDQPLNSGNEHLHYWEIGNGQTLSLGVPKDGREASIINVTSVNAFIFGQIGGSPQTITLVPGACIHLKYFGNATTWRITGRYTP